jgi:inner membrane protein
VDPLTHALSGLTVSLSLPIQEKRQHLFCVIAASLPDIDNFAFFMGKEMYLLYHRGFCHSFVGGFILSIILTGIFRFFNKDILWLRSLCLAYSLVCLHLFLDLITSYGTQLFLPFTNYRCAIPCVFIIDFVLTGVLISGVVLSLFIPAKRNAIALICLCLILVYPIYGKIIQYIQLERIKSISQNNYESIHVLPAFFAPLYWKVIVDKTSHYELRHLSIFSAIDMYPPHKFEKANLNKYIQQKQQNSLLITYAWFLDYPAVREDENKCLHIFDLKFISANPWLNQFYDKNHIPFALTIHPDNQCMRNQ